MALAVALVAGACDQAAVTPAAGPIAATAREPVLEGQLDIIAWPGYIERGQADKSRDWVAAFEAKTDCKVRVRTAASSDEMVALMNQGGFDLVTASGDASLRLIAGGKVQPLETSRIPSYAGIDARLRNAAWHTVDAVHYGVPFQWGPNLLMYDASVFKEPPTSWRVVFEEQEIPDGKSNKGRVQAFDGPIYIADAAVYLKQARPDLRIEDPYQLSEVQYAAALALLRRQKPLVHRYWRDPGVQVGDFRNEGVVASMSWPAQVNALQAMNASVGAVIPDEGATGWADTMMLHSAAKHPNCAYKWMEWALDPKVQGDVAASFGSVPAVPAACSDNPLLGVDGCSRNGLESFERIYFWRTPGLGCGKGKCVPYSRWTEDFLKLVDG